MSTEEEELIASIIADDILNDLSTENAKATVEDWQEGGIVISIVESVLKVKGITNAEVMEEVVFDNGALGFVYSIKQYYAYVLVLKDNPERKIAVNSIVRKLGRRLSVKAGDFSGRILNCVGDPIDGLGSLKWNKEMLVEKTPRPIIERQSINKPLYTGITVIDSIIPLGKGQRSLIIGDRKTGKTSIGIDSIINQKNFLGTDQEVYCIYVAIGQKQKDIATVVQRLKDEKAISYTTVIAVNSSETAASVYIAPYFAAALSEYYCFNLNKDVFIVYDDLSKHAMSHRTIDLILKKPPGREAYSGDVFYLHARLLERSGAFREGKSITSFSIMETQAGDISGYITTNVISITDGQLFLESELFHRGIKPAINIGKSVSRIGSAAQEGLLKEESKQLKIGLMQYHQYAAYTKIVQDVSEGVQAILKRGELLTELIKQVEGDIRRPGESAVLIIAAESGLLNKVKNIKLTVKQITIYFNTNHEQLMTEIVSSKKEELQRHKEEILKILKDNPSLLI